MEDAPAATNVPGHRGCRKDQLAKDGHLGCAVLRQMVAIVTLGSLGVRRAANLQKEAKILGRRTRLLLLMVLLLLVRTET